MTKTEMDATYFAKTPPQAVSLEEAVLGAILLDKSGLGRVSFLKRAHFYREEHGDIYAACKSLASKGRGIDILTVMDELKSMKKLDFVGGPAYLAELTHRVASSANAEYHARIIVQQFLLREVIRIGSESARDAYEMGADALEILDDGVAKQVDVLGSLCLQALRIHSLSHLLPLLHCLLFWFHVIFASTIFQFLRCIAGTQAPAARLVLVCSRQTPNNPSHRHQDQRQNS